MRNDARSAMHSIDDAGACSHVDGLLTKLVRRRSDQTRRASRCLFLHALRHSISDRDFQITSRGISTWPDHRGQNGRRFAIAIFKILREKLRNRGIATDSSPVRPAKNFRDATHLEPALPCSPSPSRSSEEAAVNAQRVQSARLRCMTNAMIGSSSRRFRALMRKSPPISTPWRDATNQRWVALDSDAGTHNGVSGAIDAVRGRDDP